MFGHLMSSHKLNSPTFSFKEIPNAELWDLIVDTTSLIGGKKLEEDANVNIPSNAFFNYCSNVMINSNNASHIIERPHLHLCHKFRSFRSSTTKTWA